MSDIRVRIRKMIVPVPQEPPRASTEATSSSTFPKSGSEAPAQGAPTETTCYSLVLEDVNRGKGKEPEDATTDSSSLPLEDVSCSEKLMVLLPILSTTGIPANLAATIEQTCRLLSSVGPVACLENAELIMGKEAMNKFLSDLFQLLLIIADILGLRADVFQQYLGMQLGQMLPLTYTPERFERLVEALLVRAARDLLGKPSTAHDSTTPQIAPGLLPGSTSSGGSETASITENERSSTEQQSSAENNKSPASMFNPNTYMTDDAIWLGCKHDGYPLSSFIGYQELRYSEPQLVEMHQSPSREYAALYQSQLTFGFLEGVIEQKIPESRLLKHTPNGIMISTDEVPRILREWMDRIKAMKAADPEALRKWFERTIRQFQYASSMLQQEVLYPGQMPWHKIGLPSDEVANIVYMVAAIGEALQVASSEFGFLLPPATKPPDWMSVVLSVNSRLAKMMADGWCPVTLRFLAKSMCVLGYASKNKPIIRDGIGEKGHADCDALRCVANTVDTATYHNRHVREECSCQYVKPPVDAVMQILSTGQVPVLTITNVNSSEGDLTFTCNNASTTSYVAFSHVWADGLGSTTEEGLPVCQVRRLAAAAERLVPGSAFWIDSLCVPKNAEMRKRAIREMGRTYNNATVVLVMDSGVQSCSVTAPLEQRLLRIVTSAWMQRLWTLQEAMLARSLVFEFSDGIVAIQDLLPDDDAPFVSPLITMLAVYVHSLLHRRNDLRYARAGLPMMGLKQVSELLYCRTSSKPEDETLAIASLLDVDPGELVSTSPRQRMKTLLLKVRNIPPYIISTPAPRLDEPCFGWAPVTLTSGHSDVISNNEAICTPEGLLATYPSIGINSTTFRGDEVWFIRLQLQSKTMMMSLEDADSERGADMKYTCNGILMEPLGPKIIQSVVAVLMDGQGISVNGKWRPRYRFIKRLQLKHWMGPQLARIDDHKVIEATGFGDLDVCLV
ncbi:hypothetical protein CERSUDRAFT_112459 [Gelatoporia subvermispora B]|uniref:Heterokaryon incompatibility domain-containing protein n=1 Tax=Ceriporiopsis subvermispora (strain B) TaxID=914234 RepID=M2RJT8_CERS8|nr:hypothetical protein CERSUDRAFT_112459 [Gelatoporia subvermispora B]